MVHWAPQHAARGLFSPDGRGGVISPLSWISMCPYAHVSFSPQNMKAFSHFVKTECEEKYKEYQEDLFLSRTHTHNPAAPLEENKSWEKEILKMSLDWTTDFSYFFPESNCVVKRKSTTFSSPCGYKCKKSLDSFVRNPLPKTKASSISLSLFVKCHARYWPWCENSISIFCTRKEHFIPKKLTISPTLSLLTLLTLLSH